jgi:hypothetical protein
LNFVLQKTFPSILIGSPQSIAEMALNNYHSLTHKLFYDFCAVQWFSR